MFGLTVHTHTHTHTHKHICHALVLQNSTQVGNVKHNYNKVVIVSNNVIRCKM